MTRKSEEADQPTEDQREWYHTFYDDAGGSAIEHNGYEEPYQAVKGEAYIEDENGERIPIGTVTNIKVSKSEGSCFWYKHFPTFIEAFEGIRDNIRLLGEWHMVKWIVETYRKYMTTAGRHTRISKREEEEYNRGYNYAMGTMMRDHSTYPRICAEASRSYIDPTAFDTGMSSATLAYQREVGSARNARERLPELQQEADILSNRDLEVSIERIELNSMSHSVPEIREVFTIIDSNTGEPFKQFSDIESLDTYLSNIRRIIAERSETPKPSSEDDCTEVTMNGKRRIRVRNG